MRQSSRYILITAGIALGILLLEMILPVVLGDPSGNGVAGYAFLMFSLFAIPVGGTLGAIVAWLITVRVPKADEGAPRSGYDRVAVDLGGLMAVAGAALLTDVLRAM